MCLCLCDPTVANFDLAASFSGICPRRASFPFVGGSVGSTLEEATYPNGSNPPNRMEIIITALHGRAQQFDRGWAQPQVPVGPRVTKIQGTGSVSLFSGAPQCC